MNAIDLAESIGNLHSNGLKIHRESKRSRLDDRSCENGALGCLDMCFGKRVRDRDIFRQTAAQPEHARRLDELAATKGVSKSSIVAAALASWLSPDAADQREAAIAKRLDRLSRQAERIERDQNIAIETLALFIRYYLTVSTPVPEAHQDAARAQGKARFEQFVEQLGRHLLRGRSLVRDVVEELHPDPARMDDAAAVAEAQERAS